MLPYASMLPKTMMNGMPNSGDPCDEAAFDAFENFMNFVMTTRVVIWRFQFSTIRYVFDPRYMEVRHRKMMISFLCPRSLYVVNGITDIRQLGPG